MFMNNVFRKKLDFIYNKMRVVKIYSSFIYVYCCFCSFCSFDKSFEDVYVFYVD